MEGLEGIEEGLVGPAQDPRLEGGIGEGEEAPGKEAGAEKAGDGVGDDSG